MMMDWLLRMQKFNLQVSAPHSHIYANERLGQD